jgi:sensor histidine kinase YesM
MQQYPFIFSNEIKYRLSRHFVFWFVWWIFQAFLYSFVFNGRTIYWLLFKNSMVESAFYLIVHVFFSYSLMYFVIPRYLLKQKYWLTAFWAVVAALIAGLMAPLLSYYIIDPLRHWILGSYYVNSGRLSGGNNNTTPVTVDVHLALMAGLRGALTIGGLASAIKLMKYWYIKEQRNLQLQKENTAAQMQLLKAQIHPHFLFNTLNNIYSYTQTVSPVGSKLVMGLSDLLRYILHEGSRQKVALASELKIIDDYILLEQIRYGNRLEINKEVPYDTKNLVIAPLILLPFVENCFKHGTSNMLDKAWIRLAIDLDGNKMKMTLINAKPMEDQEEKKQESGIGITNVRKRLDLLYKDKHELIITEEEGVFIVRLWIELEKNPNLTIHNQQLPAGPAILQTADC